MTTGGRRIKGSGAAKIAKPNAPIKLTSQEIDALSDAIKWAKYRDTEALASAKIKLAALKQRLLTKAAVS
jgi:hypothetical protein